MNKLKVIKDFVEGRTSPAELEEIIYKNKEFEKEFENLEIPGRTSGEGFFNYLISKNFKSIIDIYIVQKSLADYLDSIGESYSLSSTYNDLLEAIAAAEPKWLSLPSEYAFKMLEEYNTSDKKIKLKKWLKDEIKKRFTYADNPPKWIQDAIWPIEDGIPLKFIKQEKNKNLHDDGYNYEFLNEKTGKKKLIIQTY